MAGGASRRDDCPACPDCPAPESDSTLQKVDALDILSLLGLLALVIALNNVAKARRWPVPPAILTMGISVAVGALATLLPEAVISGFRKLDALAAMQFLTVWLAPIIFAEGYAMRTKMFFENIVRILAHAFLGTTVSAIVVALCVHRIPPLLGSDVHLTMGESLTFGALISATDPVTTLAIFKEQRMAENGLGHLYYTVLGESVLNDAVGITLFTMFGQLVTAEKDDIGFEDVANITTEFMSTFVGSMTIGLCLGCLMPLVLKHTPLSSESPSIESERATPNPHAHGIMDDDSEGEEELEFNVPEIGVALVLGMIPYLLAEACNLSGIVAIMFAGMVARYYAHHNLTRETRQVFLPTVELVAQLCETYVFIILGLGAFLFQGNYSMPLILSATLGCLLGRAAHVYPFSAIVNCCSKSEKLQMNEQHMVCFAGLRGAIAFICAFSFPETANHRHRYDIICTTTVIVGGSLLGMGWPTTAMMRWLDIKPHNMLPTLASPSAVQASLSTRAQSGARKTSHRRSRSDTPAIASGRVQDFSNGMEAGQSPTNNGVPGVFKRLDRTLRRFLMTRDAIYQTNKQQFRRSVRASVGSAPPAACDHRQAKSWGYVGLPMPEIESDDDVATGRSRRNTEDSIVAAAMSRRNTEDSTSHEARGPWPSTSPRSSRSPRSNCESRNASKEQDGDPLAAPLLPESAHGDIGGAFRKSVGGC